MMITELLDIIDTELQPLKDTRNKVQTKLGVLRREEREVSERIDKLQDAINSIQAICDHTMVYDGTTSHGRESWEKCTKCSLVRLT